ncbi:MAG: DpnI domain-containing protein [Endomicrobiaceae bacterium]
MTLYLNKKNGNKYSSPSQKIRVMSEQWTKENIFCPRCGNGTINKVKNNKPVFDFICPKCKSVYELKSKKRNIGKKVVDGAYDTMITRITSYNNPDFFFMSYNSYDFKVKDFIFIPKHFFTPEIIEKRKPLSETASRAGWVGCNIILKDIPEDGRIYIIRDGLTVKQNIVKKKVKRTSFLQDAKIVKRRWIIDILNCINRIDKKEFSLAEMYSFEEELSKKYSENKHVKDKIRQQLQLLRDKNYIKFLGRGKYKKG